MKYTVPIIGDGQPGGGDPLRPAIGGWHSWTDNGDGTASVTVTTTMALRVRNFAASAADALNGGSAWSDLTAIKPDNLPLTLIKQDLTNTVKKKFSEMSSVPQGFVVSHDNGTTKGLWRADTDTTAEPAQGHSDWTLVFEITV